MAAPINPKGAKSDKLWRAAIMRAVMRSESGKPTSDAQRLEHLADKLVEQGLTGDIPALREIGDRLDGKPTQPVGGDDDASPIVHRIERVIVRLTDQDRPSI